MIKIDSKENAPKLYDCRKVNRAYYDYVKILKMTRLLKETKI